MFRFFTFNEKGAVSLDNDTLKTIPEFKVLLSIKYNTGEGDAQGILKKKATKVISYIYFMYDLRSPFSQITDEEERHKNCLLSCGLGPTWKPDKYVKAAIDVYLENVDNLFPELKTLRTLKEGLGIGQRLAAFSNKRMLKLLDKLESINFDEIDEQTLQTYEAVIASIKNELKYVLEAVPKLNASIDTVLEFESKITQDFKEKERGKGGREIGNRADPK
jgi:hypothetical protein